MTDHKEPATALICAKCGVDRFKSPCARGNENCPMIADALSQPKASAVPEQSQSVQPSIDTQEFQQIARAWESWRGYQEQVKFIDAKLAQARDGQYQLGYSAAFEDFVERNLELKGRADSMEAARDDAVQAEYRAIARAEAAEAQLAAILKTKTDTSNLPD
jgi:hypothetical protein